MELTHKNEIISLSFGSWITIRTSNNLEAWMDTIIELEVFDYICEVLGVNLEWVFSMKVWRKRVEKYKNKAFDRKKFRKSSWCALGARPCMCRWPISVYTLFVLPCFAYCLNVVLAHPIDLDISGFASRNRESK